jgi:AsmA protein
MKPSKKPTSASSGKQPPAPSSSSLKHALLGLYGIVGLSISTFGGFKVPFAESHAKDYWRHAVAGIVILLVLIAAIVSLALYMFDANYFKSQMVDYVKTHNQRDLTLEGDIKVTFFPQLGLDSGKMSLSQRNSGKGFASIENARLYIAWWPLLRKQLQIERVVLDGVHANVIRYKNGSSNLDDLLTTDASLGDIKFEIDSIKVNNSSANLQDETAGILLTLHNLNIETGKLTDSTPGNVTANFRLESAKPRIDTKVKLNSHVLFELKTNHYEFANFEGEMEGEAGALSNLALTFQGTLNSYPAMERLVVDKFSASARGKLENRRLEAKLDIPKLQLVKNELTGNTLTFNASLLQEDENLTTTIELPAFVMKDKKLLADSISANVDLFRKGGTLQGTLSSPLNIDFAASQIQLPVIASNFSGTHPLLSSKLSANISGNMQANLSEQNVKLGFKTKIDDSNIAGSLGMQGFSHPAYTFDIGANTLDLDRYLAADWAKRFKDDALPFDFSGLKDLNLRGKLRSNEFKFAKLKTSNLLADIKADQATLLIEPLNARLYGGTASGSLSISAIETPQFTFRQKLTGVQINALLADIFPGEAKLAGKGNFSLDLNATGKNIGALRKGLNGNISLAIARGSLAGINLTDALVAGKDQLGIKDGERTEPAKFTEATPFAELKSSFDINQGKASNSEFLMKSPLFTSKGEGDITLESGQLNYRLNTTVAANLKRSSNGELAELKGISIPVRVTGPYATPSIMLDFANASGMKTPKPPREVQVKPAPTAAKTSKPAKK